MVVSNVVRLGVYSSVEHCHRAPSALLNLSDAGEWHLARWSKKPWHARRYQIFSLEAGEERTSSPRPCVTTGMRRARCGDLPSGIVLPSIQAVIPHRRRIAVRQLISNSASTRHGNSDREQRR